MYSPLCVGPGRKREDRFSHNEAQINHEKYHDESKTGTRQMQRVALQVEIGGKSNNETENLKFNPGGPSDRRLSVSPNRLK